MTIIKSHGNNFRLSWEVRERQKAEKKWWENSKRGKNATCHLNWSKSHLFRQTETDRQIQRDTELERHRETQTHRDTLTDRKKDLTQSPHHNENYWNPKGWKQLKPQNTQLRRHYCMTKNIATMFSNSWFPLLIPLKPCTIWHLIHHRLEFASAVVQSHLVNCHNHVNQANMLIS